MKAPKWIPLVLCVTVQAMASDWVGKYQVVRDQPMVTVESGKPPRDAGISRFTYYLELRSDHRLLVGSKGFGWNTSVAQWGSWTIAGRWVCYWCTDGAASAWAGALDGRTTADALEVDHWLGFGLSPVKHIPRVTDLDFTVPPIPKDFEETCRRFDRLISSYHTVEFEGAADRTELIRRFTEALQRDDIDELMRLSRQSAVLYPSEDTARLKMYLFYVPLILQHGELSIKEQPAEEFSTSLEQMKTGGYGYTDGVTPMGRLMVGKGATAHSSSSLGHEIGVINGRWAMIGPTMKLAAIKEQLEKESAKAK